MSMLTKLRCITLDVTGILIAYNGELSDYYCMAAKSAGLPCPDYKCEHEGFKIAYSNMAKEHPFFGFAEKIPNIVWWKTCVRDSFAKAGYDYDDETFEKVFRRIYSTFGSAAPYTMFSDSKHFLRWARKEGLLVGLVSNAEYRYEDVILPTMGLNQARIHQLQTSKLIEIKLFALHQGVNVVIECVVEVDADCSRFPNQWLFKVCSSWKLLSHRKKPLEGMLLDLPTSAMH